MAEQEFKVIQREEDHERQLYDDSLSVIAVLEDIRVGDVIEYAFSIRGDNPVFEGRAYWILTTSYSQPVGAILGVLRHPESYPMQLTRHNTELEPEISTDASNRVLQWFIEKPAALLSEGGLPSHYDPWGWIEATSWKDWFRRLKSKLGTKAAVTAELHLGKLHTFAPGTLCAARLQSSG